MRRSAAARIGRLLSARTGSFQTLLASLVAVYAITALGPQLPLDTAGPTIVVVLVIVASLYALSANARTLRIGIGFALGILALRAIAPHVLEHAATITHHALLTLFLIWMVAVSAREMIERERVLDPDAILGALCGYLLLVFLFTQLFMMGEFLAPGSFLAGEARLPTEAAPRAAVLQYFSVVTITTLGYGDVRPATEFARFLAASEALIGQLYVATVIAALVGLRHSRREHPRSN